MRASRREPTTRLRQSRISCVSRPPIRISSTSRPATLTPTMNGCRSLKCADCCTVCAMISSAATHSPEPIRIRIETSVRFQSCGDHVYHSLRCRQSSDQNRMKRKVSGMVRTSRLARRLISWRRSGRTSAWSRIGRLLMTRSAVERGVERRVGRLLAAVQIAHQVALAERVIDQLVALVERRDRFVEPVASAGAGPRSPGAA